ncbi:hypothetical protein BJ138DRAFT_1105598 [Hygrophoropsis aurantiaca]|uniref:Uncharacterized protein n=1 Tax=Hygrophoropsis aurantiaca TaxID=72124 RepID=A0ACB7ZYX5_9AGAM|nr:hypothetical protein BJ138DRAFT_1105598 [Hygrophoropsis aurantiaca]
MNMLEEGGRDIGGVTWREYPELSTSLGLELSPWRSLERILALLADAKQHATTFMFSRLGTFGQFGSDRRRNSYTPSRHASALVGGVLVVREVIRRRTPGVSPQTSRTTFYIFEINRERAIDCLNTRDDVYILLTHRYVLQALSSPICQNIALELHLTESECAGTLSTANASLESPVAAELRLESRAADPSITNELAS